MEIIRRREQAEAEREHAERTLAGVPFLVCPRVAGEWAQRLIERCAPGL
jgi:hypothetical protein